MKKYFYVVSLLVVFSLVLTGMANAASTIGTDMSTTGTFTQTVGSATAARFQNAAGTLTVFQVNTSTGTGRVGVGAAPSTTFEVQGTASASYFFTANTIQVGGGMVASVAYNRFGSTATTHSLSAVNDVLINGKLEVDGDVLFDTETGVSIGDTGPSTVFEVQGTASASYFFTGNTIQVGGGIVASVAYNRFGSTATTRSLSATNDVLINGKLEVDGNAFFDAKVGIGGATNTVFEVQGTASASYFLTGNTIQVGGFASVAYNRFGASATTHSLSATNDVLVNGILEVDGKAFFDGTASVASDFEVTGYASASKGFFQTDIVVNHNVASSSSIYVAEFGGGAGTATVSIMFGSSSASSKGTCFQMKNDVGTWVYARIVGTTWTVNSIKCHN